MLHTSVCHGTADGIPTDPRGESDTQDEEISQTVSHGSPAVFQHCHPVVDTFRGQCAGHVGHCPDNGRGLERSVAHVAQDFAGSETDSIVTISFREHDTADVNGRL